MSHFSVMVITAEEPTEENLRKILAPWHEFECTGTDNEFVRDIDQTAELRERYATDERAMLRAPDGALYDAYDERFYREQTAEERASANVFDRGRKIRVVPPDYVEEQVPARSLVSFRQYVEREDCDRAVPFGSEPDTADAHKYGYVLLTADGDVYKVIRRTNPNAKWDWWSVGGRWSGMLAPDYDPHVDPANKETCFLCAGTGKRTDMDVASGCNGCDGTGLRLKHASSWRQFGNEAQIRGIPVAALRDEAGRKAGELWDKRTAVVASRPIPDFDALREQHGAEKAREIYWADPVMKDLQTAGEHFLEKSDLDEMRGTREAAVERGRRSALVPFAVVKDGQWHERGSMGWFAMVSDEKNPDAWELEVSALFDNLPPDTWVAVVDCHI